MATLGSLPADVRRFPRRTLRSGEDLYRIHPHEHGASWFSSDGHGRFDLHPPEGTCYLARSPLGSFVEVFRDVSLVDPSDVARRVVSHVRAPSALRLADCTSPRALAFGVTAAIHSTPDYALTQSWARAWAAADFAGVRYLCGHDPSQREIGIAMFGKAGAPDWPTQGRTPIDDAVLTAVARRFGIRVVPTPSRR